MNKEIKKVPGTAYLVPGVALQLRGGSPPDVVRCSYDGDESSSLVEDLDGRARYEVLVVCQLVGPNLRDVCVSFISFTTIRPWALTSP